MTGKMVLTATMAAALVALGAMAQDAKQAPAPAMDAQQKAAMDAWQKAATPGANHRKLAEMAGTWEVTVKSYEGGGEPQVSKGKALRKMILGGRFLQEEYKGSYMGQPFDGLGLTGYDNVLKQFSLLWMDSMGTGMATGKGQMDPAGKTLSSTVEFTDPVTGKVVSMRQAMHRLDSDTESFEMYGPGPDGKEAKMMEMLYKRVK